MRRMILIFGLLGIWGLSISTAAAQVVTLRSGQHDGFVRLVLTLPEPAGWDFGRTADGYGFRSRIAGVRYDLSTIYQRIGRDRLVAVWVDPGTGVLRLEVGCDCHAIAEPFRPGIVLIDLADGPPPAESPFEAALDLPGQVVPRLTTTGARRPVRRPHDFIPLPQIAEPWFLAVPQQPDLRPRLALPLPQSDRQQIAASLVGILEQAVVNGAATSAPGPWRQLSMTPSPPNAHLRTFEQAATQIRLVDPAQPTRGIEAATGNCPPDSWLALETWTADIPAADEIALGRQLLLGEFDQPDHEHVMALARTHVHYGFGVEAREILRLWAPQDDEADILTALAQLIDDESAHTVFATMQECNGAAALWAVLAGAELSKPTDLDTAAVIRHYSALPVHLRHDLGPRLIDRLLAHGDEATASVIRNVYRRSSKVEDPGLVAVDAGLTLWRGQDPAADTSLEEASRHREVTPDALAALVASQLQRGQRPDETLIEALESLLNEYRGTTRAPTLRRALAQVLTVHGHHHRAFAEFATDDAELAVVLWRVLAQLGSRAAVAEIALITDDAAIDALPPALRHEVARRLLAGGFAHQAARWIMNDSAPETELLRANVALGQWDGATAVRLLAGRDDAPAQEVTARALEQLHEHAAAAVAWSATGNVEAAGHAYVRAGDWDQVGADAETPWAVLLKEKPAGGSESALDLSEATKKLALSRALLEESVAIRNEIMEALMALPTVTHFSGG